MQTLDLIIVGSGPAGRAAASHAQSTGLSYALLERTDHRADTVDAYQARKYVMAEPMLIPARGEVPFLAGSRESILAAWGGHVSEKQLNVLFNAEAKSVTKDGGRFQVATAKGEKYDAANVILAMGTQGNPRKLGVPGEDLPHVRYRLVDPAEHRDQDLLVVGAGDSALEIAIALADENRVGLIVRGTEITRANDVLTKDILGRQAIGQLTIYFSASVKEVYPGYADLTVR